MRSNMLVVLALCVAVIGLTACGDDGGASDAGLDGSTDTDTDADAGPDAGEECSPDVTCPIHVVGEGGDDCNSGSSWDDGLATVERGLDLAEPLGCDVWVKAGTYHPTEDVEGSSTPDDPQTVTFRLRSGVALYGGFAGDEMELGERDFEVNQTILSGDIGDIGDSGDCWGSDNAYHVVTGADDAIIDGFVITDGTVNSSDLGATGGGGMINISASPTVTNCTFSDNSVCCGLEDCFGGGMYNEDSSPIVANCTFSGNTARNPFFPISHPARGGGMGNLSSSPTVTSCTFSTNDADYGGGMFNGDGSSTAVADCMFSDNSAGQLGGGMYNSLSSPNVTGSTFSTNIAIDTTFDGGGIGGGMFNFDSSPTVTSCVFSDNQAADAGGGMGNNGGSPTATNCAFWNNSVGSYSPGGGIYNYDSSPTLTNCTFSGNSADSGGGMYNAGDFDTPTLTNCIMWGNASGITEGGDSLSVVTYSNIQSVYEGEGNIHVNPQFVDAEGGDLRLQEGSPCIDVGSNEAVPDGGVTDLDGNPRIVDGNGDTTAIVDMGAYEFQP